MKRRTWFIVAVALVILLVTAAFVGGQLLNTERVAGASPFQMVSGQPGAESGANAQGMQTAVDMEMEPAREIPQTEPDVAGLLARRSDNSIFITTGKVVMTIGINPDGSYAVNGTADGPEVEVVIPHTAQILVDTTALTAIDAPQSDGTRKQTVEPGNVDEINEHGIISVWGERRGDRVIAHTVLYMADALSAMPNPQK
jgi:hypothetical protein